MLYGASGKLVGMGSSFSSANAFARMYLWQDVAPAVSIALATTSQFLNSVDILDWVISDIIFASPSGEWWRWNPALGRTRRTKEHLVSIMIESPLVLVHIAKTAWSQLLLAEEKCSLAPMQPTILGWFPSDAGLFLLRALQKLWVDLPIQWIYASDATSAEQSLRNQVACSTEE